MRALAVTPLAFAAGAIAMRAAFARLPAALHANALAQPLVVATAWGSPGAFLWAILATTIALGAVGYVMAFGVAPRLTLAAIVASCAAALAAAWAFPVWFSSDVYAYAVYGELSRLGMDPFARVSLPHGNPIFEAAFPQWGNPIPVCVYGPVFVDVARGLVKIASSMGVRAVLDAFRVAASVSLLGCAAIAYAIGGPDPRRAGGCAIAIALNPVVIWSCAEGHNDAIALLAVLAGFWVLKRYGPGAGAFVVALAASIKVPAALGAVGIVAAGGRTRSAWLGAAMGLAIVAVLSVPLLAGTLQHAGSRGPYAPQASFQALFFFSPRLGISFTAAAAAACATFGVLSLARRQPDGWCALGLGAWLLIPNPYPWYAIWLLALVLLAPHGRFSRVLLALALLTPLRYLPDAAGTLNQPWPLLVAVLACSPLAALFRKPAIIRRS